MLIKHFLRRISYSIIAATTIITFNSSAYAAISPTGYWKTFDNKTGQPSSIVQIYSVNNNLFAKIIKTLPIAGKPSPAVCAKCTGSLHNAPLIGLVFMTNMQQLDPKTWGRGRLLDPKTGKVYQGTIKQVDENTLKLKGYAGLPAFSRTATWVRMNFKELNSH